MANLRDDGSDLLEATSMLYNVSTYSDYSPLPSYSEVSTHLIISIYMIIILVWANGFYSIHNILYKVWISNVILPLLINCWAVTQQDIKVFIPDGH